MVNQQPNDNDVRSWCALSCLSRGTADFCQKNQKERADHGLGGPGSGACFLVALVAPGWVRGWAGVGQVMVRVVRPVVSVMPVVRHFRTDGVGSTMTWTADRPAKRPDVMVPVAVVVIWPATTLLLPVYS